jgi:uncharacterized protein
MGGSGPRRASALGLVVLLLGALPCRGEDALPAAPSQRFNDYAHFVPEPEARRLEAKLRRFQEETSNEVLVAVFPELPSESLEDFTVRTAQAWRVGRKGLSNGVVLFVFVKERKVRFEVGYGLEGALPDALARRIIEDEIVPRFLARDPTGGLEAGIDAVIKATRGEYKPSPRRGVSPTAVLVLILIVILLLIWLEGRGGPTVYTGSGWRTYRRSPWGGTWGSGGGISYGGGWGGGSGGSGGGGYSGGGGQFGGGGASGSW